MLEKVPGVNEDFCMVNEDDLGVIEEIPGPGEVCEIIEQVLKLFDEA